MKRAVKAFLKFSKDKSEVYLTDGDKIQDYTVMKSISYLPTIFRLFCAQLRKQSSDQRAATSSNQRI